MKQWSDIAPQGTAAWCDAWREAYRTMDFRAQQEAADAILGAHPNQAGYDAEGVLRCLGLVDGPIMVLEFGGWTGGLARTMLTLNQRIKLWDNYEISSIAKNNPDCFYPHYKIVVPETFVWDTPQLTEGHNFFISSHAIEHITKEDLAKLFAWLPTTIAHIFLQAPIPEDCDDNKWKGYGGTHILECGWHQVIEMLPEFRLAYRGGIRYECLFFERKP